MVASLENKSTMAANTKPLTAAGTLLGIGLGGFVDGILFHQILQLHSMLSARLPQDVLIPDAPNVTSLRGAPPVWAVWNHMDFVVHPPLYCMTLRLWRDGSSPVGPESI